MFFITFLIPNDTIIQHFGTILFIHSIFMRLKRDFEVFILRMLDIRGFTRYHRRLTTFLNLISCSVKDLRVFLPGFLLFSLFSRLFTVIYTFELRYTKRWFILLQCCVKKVIGRVMDNMIEIRWWNRIEGGAGIEEWRMY